jgi:hypothetical protein
MKLASSRVSSDLFLMLTSVAIAFVVWLIAKEGELGQESFNVPVYLRNVPANIKATLPLSAVRLLTSEPKSVGAQLRADFFIVELDWDRLPNPRNWCGTREKEGSTAVTLDPSRVVLSDQIQISEDLKQQILRSVQYLEIQPNRMQVQGQYVTRPAHIVFKPINSVAKGYELGPITLTDSSRDVLLTASPAVFEALNAKGPDDPVDVPTKEIDLAARRETQTETVALVLPDKVEMANGEDPRVEVKVPVVENIQTVTIADVPVVVTPQNKSFDVEFAQQNSVEVIVKVPEQMVDAVKAPANWLVHPTTLPDETVGKEISVKVSAELVSTVSPEVRKAVQMLSTNPSSVKIKFKQRITPSHLLDSAKPDSINP